MIIFVLTFILCLQWRNSWIGWCTYMYIHIYYSNTVSRNLIINKYSDDQYAWQSSDLRNSPATVAQTSRISHRAGNFERYQPHGQVLKPTPNWPKKRASVFPPLTLWARSGHPLMWTTVVPYPYEMPSGSCEALWPSSVALKMHPRRHLNPGSG